MHSKTQDRLKRKSVMYVNYAPYGNAGYILDYLKSSFDEVVYISLVFHPVEPRSRNTVEIFRQGSPVKRFHIPTLRAPKKHVHQLAFLLSFIAGFELVALTVYLRLRHKVRPWLFLAPNAFLVYVGVLMRTFSLVRNVVFWVWDFYPTPRKGVYRKLLFKMYWRLDSRCTRKADFVWYLNERLLEVRKNMGVEIDSLMHCVAPLGISPIDQDDLPHIKKDTLGFVGVLKKGQGLDLMLDSLPELVAKRSDLKVEIIGSGPDEAYFKDKAGDNPEGRRASFLGFIESDEEMRKTIASWSAAMALYVPSEENVASFTDPSKVRLYIGCGVPVIMTGVPEISGLIDRNDAGMVIGYSTDDLVRAVDKVLSNNTFYRENSLRLGREYDYEQVYDKVFARVLNSLEPVSEGKS